MAIELETEHLRLRQWRETDVDPYLAFYRDPLSAILYGDDVTRSDVWRRVCSFIGQWYFRGYGMWALEDKATGQFAGYGGLWNPPEFGDVEVGYGIAPQFRGRGYAPEAARAARDFGYGPCGLKRLVSYVRPSNPQSIRVAEKLGAEPEGEFLLHSMAHIVFLHRKSSLPDDQSRR